MTAVENLCSRCLVLHAGAVICDDNVSAAISHYSQTHSGKNHSPHSMQGSSISGRNGVIESFFLSQANGSRTNEFALGGEAFFNMCLKSTERLPSIDVNISIYDEIGSRSFILESKTQFSGTINLDNRISIRCALGNIRIYPGRYRAVAKVLQFGILIDQVESEFCFNVLSSNIYGTGKIPLKKCGAYLPEVSWQYGVEDISSEL